MIIAVGFKINNERAIQFIKWANTIALAAPTGAAWIATAALLP